MADLLTLAELKERLGIGVTDTRYDTELQRALSSASAAIAAFTERDFGAPQVTEARTFQYDGTGYLDIDDADDVTAVELVVSGFPNQALSSDQWVAQPARRDDAPVFTYLLMPGVTGAAGSPEMGFTRNVDVYAAEGRWRTLPATVNVTGVWGWPTVPDDVKQAAVWTVEEFRPRSPGGRSSEALTSEAIEGFARSWNRQGGGSAMLAIPNRARDILSNYARWNV